ncbi:BTB/POZ domain-containing protein KCTD9 [Octopus sinensis]|uniref:BTB/POZ domain-containing protein KCTD9 n=1 Tax=Octopus sinensis TaxID=2607531 RepID=A0A6P7T5W9_9MOLL|nr:BTB/POZ domain-containing protein KCTD9 [Octopus sinensis]
MKRIIIFLNGSSTDGKVIGLGKSLDEILLEAGRKLGITARSLYTPQGGLIDDIKLIRDDDVLYVSDGEPFKPYLSTRTSHHASVSVAPTVAAKEKQRTKLVPADRNEWLTLNIGGKLFSTTRSTLTRQEPASMLARMFSDQSEVPWNSSVDANGAYLIDRSPTYFEPILNYLRHGQLILDKNVNPEGVLEEARFFGLDYLVGLLEEIIEREAPADDSTPINRREFVLRLMSTSARSELRCQGLNFQSANLSKLDLRSVNFKYAILRKANLSGANLSFCNFERSDLSGAILDCANLQGIKMVCANLEGSSLCSCNFEDPAGHQANMEGAQMKNVILEGSHMASVNLRVATLKNANLKNCDLRGAVLAGADLENCDLSGSDLQDANLRGANLTGATFKLMLNALHMSQTLR